MQRDKNAVVHLRRRCTSEDFTLLTSVLLIVREELLCSDLEQMTMESPNAIPVVVNAIARQVRQAKELVTVYVTTDIDFTITL